MALRTSCETLAFSFGFMQKKDEGKKKFAKVTTHNYNIRKETCIKNQSTVIESQLHPCLDRSTLEPCCEMQCLNGEKRHI